MTNDELQKQKESLGNEYYKIGQTELEQKNDKEAIRNFVYAVCLNFNLYDVYLKLAKLSEEYKLYELSQSCYDLYIKKTNTPDLEIRNHYEELSNKLKNKQLDNASTFEELYGTHVKREIDLLDYSNKVKKIYREVLEYSINWYFDVVVSLGLNGFYSSILAQLLDIKHYVVECGNSKGLKSRYSLKNMIKYNGIYDYFMEEEYQLLKYLYFTALIYNEIPEESWEQ